MGFLVVHRTVRLPSFRFQFANEYERLYPLFNLGYPHVQHLVKVFFKVAYNPYLYFCDLKGRYLVQLSYVPVPTTHSRKY